ncbi:MAG: prolyl oligopeptidase family serine peptidase [Conexivisphaerales archaeon]
MSSPAVAPYGSWKSPITSDLLANRNNYIDQMLIDGRDIYWTEVRPSENGRFVLMRKRLNEEPEEVLGKEYNVRTAVHEYGGGAFTVKNALLFFSNFSDGSIYLAEEGDVRPITEQGDFRYADMVFDYSTRRLICIREDHSQPQVINSIVMIDVDSGRTSTLVSGNDFYSSPRLSPDGKKLAWLTWNHPDMPWDSAELHVANFMDDTLHGERKIAGGKDESVFQPEFSPAGTLYFISDKTGFWNLYRLGNESVEPLLAMDADFGVPQWRFGLSTYAIESEERIVCSWLKDGVGNIGILSIGKGLERLSIPYTYFSFVRAANNHAVFVAASPTEFPCIVQYSVSGRNYDVVYRPKAPVIDLGYLSTPRQIEFPTSGSRKAYANFYECKNRDFVGPKGQRPPLIVICHGGPTSFTPAILSAEVQFWTSRGFSVAQVNYGGSSGYGRQYRNILYGNWGVVDVEDAVRCAEYIVKAGKADQKKLIIRGGSAGGFTTLCALTFKKTFSAGASYYGVSDLEMLLQETHKFESHYLEKLVGPYPAAKKLYEERSPLKNLKKLSTPVALFQGSDDKVVPSNQSEKVYSALKEKGVPVLYMVFQGEKHGFVTSEAIKKAIEAELYFYSKLFGFNPADQIGPYQIDNLKA